MSEQALGFLAMPAIFVADSTIGALAMSKIMTPRFRSGTTMIGVIIVSFVLGVLCAAHCTSIKFITTTALALSVGGCLVLFRNRLSLKLKAAGIVTGAAVAAIAISVWIMFLGAAPESIPDSLGDLIPDSSLPLFAAVVVTLPPSIFTLFILVLVAVWKRHETGWVRKSEFAFHSCIALIVLLISLYVFFVAWHPPEKFQISIGIGLALLLIGLLILRHTYNQFIREREQMNLRTGCLLSAEERRQFETLSSELIHMRRIRHDLGNHALVLRNLCALGKRQEATAYLQSLRTSVEGFPKVRNMSPSVHTLIEMKQAFLRKHGVSFFVHNIDDADLETWEQLDTLAELGACILSGRHEASIEAWKDENTWHICFSPCTAAEIKEASLCIDRSLVDFHLETEAPQRQHLLLHSCDTWRNSPDGN